MCQNEPKEYEGIPVYVLKALSEARSNASCNMIDKAGVIKLCSDLEYYDAVVWLSDASNGQYMKALRAFPEWEKEQ